MKEESESQSSEEEPVTQAEPMIKTKSVSSSDSNPLEVASEKLPAYEFQQPDVVEQTHQIEKEGPEDDEYVKQIQSQIEEIEAQKEQRKQEQEYKRQRDELIQTQKEEELAQEQEKIQQKQNEMIERVKQQNKLARKMKEGTPHEEESPDKKEVSAVKKRP